MKTTKEMIIETYKIVNVSESLKWSQNSKGAESIKTLRDVAQLAKYAWSKTSGTKSFKMFAEMMNDESAGIEDFGKSTINDSILDLNDRIVVIVNGKEIDLITLFKEVDLLD